MNTILFVIACFTLGLLVGCRGDVKAAWLGARIVAKELKDKLRGRK